MPKQCKASRCNTYIGDSQDFCRRHWDMLPAPLQMSLKRTATAVQRGDDGAHAARNKAVNESSDAIANIERQAALKSTPAPSSPLQAR